MAAIVAFVAWVDTAALGRAIGALTSRPLMTAAALGAFGGAFLLRAVAWARVLPGLAPGHAWAALHVALAGNHLLPLRLGEPLRIVSVVRRTRVGAPEATASTVTVRSADVLAVVGLAALFGGLGIVGSG
ncbi:MAG: lysylphosphatidylglycerol synthase domain-containing protein, partial [Acidimicrobiia bacterium]|nr:lysylphosphatidylglycerol synthase domain-containing protein [Acidimicrobiia bacterium]